MTTKDTSKAAPSGGEAKVAAKSKVSSAKAGVCFVKSVLSGSSVVVSGIAIGGSVMPPEKIIVLSGVSAPKLQGKKGTDEDEPFAFQAREYLRKKLIGKQVQFTVNHQNESSSREYGNLTFKGESIVDSVVSAGYAVVKGGKDGKIHPDREAIYTLQTQAEKAGCGMHNKSAPKNASVRQVEFEPDNFEFYFKNKGKRVPVIVDYVRNGSTVRVEVPSPDMKHKIITVSFAGIVCPRTPLRNAKGRKGDQKSSPVAALAQYFVAKRILKRDMDLIPLGIDKYGNLYGQLQFRAFPERDITKLLLKHGLGRYLGWTGVMCDPKVAAGYKNCEAMAKARLIGVWGGAQKQVVVEPPRVASMKVVAVNSGDSLTLADAKGKEVRVNLASIRTPRLGGRRDQRDEAEPLGFEAKEYLRKKLISKQVNVRFEYTRKSPYVSIGSGKNNIALALCSMGYGTVVSHRIEEPRAYNYLQLVLAEKKAEKGKMGVFAVPKPTVHKYTDLTERAHVEKDAKDGAKPFKRGEAEVARSEVWLTKFGTGRMKGHVEYVISGSKMKVYFPSKKVMCFVVLAGVQVPRTAGKSSKGDKYGEEAHAYVNSLVRQQTVHVEVTAVDRGGSFVGYIFTDNPKKNLACCLLERGLAKIYMRSAEAGDYLKELRAAESGSKKDRIKLWANFDEEEKKRKAERVAVQKEEQVSKNQSVVVTEIVDGITFYAQTKDTKDGKKIEDAMKALEGTAQPEGYEPEFGEFAACKYDGGWHRVRVEEVDDMNAEVFFIDYGNKAEALVSDILPVSEEVSMIKPIANKCILAAISQPSENSGWAIQAYKKLGDLIYNRELELEVFMKDNKGALHVSAKLIGEEKAQPIQSALLKEGLARLQRRTADYSMKHLARELKSCEREGINERVGIWEYGEISDEEDEVPRDLQRR